MNFPTAFLLVASLAAGLAAHHLGWLALPALLDMGMILIGLVGLGGILKLPWDIYFEARGLVLDQAESERRGIEVDSEERLYAASAARRLLLLCFVCHATAAAVSAGVSWASGGRIGYAFSGFFLLSTAFRPLAAFYQHMKARLLELRRRARYPREDVLQLLAQVRGAEGTGRQLEERLRQVSEQLEEVSHDATRSRGRLERRLEELDARQTAQARGHEAQVDRVCREFESAVARLTSEREILEGMRAFVRLVKETGSTPEGA